MGLTTLPPVGSIVCWNRYGTLRYLLITPETRLKDTFLWGHWTNDSSGVKTERELEINPGETHLIITEPSLRVLSYPTLERDILWD
jgi:hypothetical protein